MEEVKKYIEDRIKLWEEFLRNYDLYEGKYPRGIREKLGYEEICLDYYYDGDCARVVINELRKVLELLRWSK